MWGIWKSSPKTEESYREAERIAASRGLGMNELIDELITDLARTPHCDECGSLDLRYCEGYMQTGVEGERRHEKWVECRRCGSR